MSQKTYFHRILLAVALPLALGGCAKQNDPVSTLVVADNNAGIKALANGRLVFATGDVFLQTQKTLSTMTGPQLDTWEKQLGIHSLRTVDITHDTARVSLMNTFGFPAQYAAMISKDGEYQIGNRISWFHDGFRYVAQSEAELATLKANPSTTTNKFTAGVRQVSPITAVSGATTKLKSGGVVNPGATTNQVVRSISSTNGDGKYGNYHFNLNDDGGSQRQLGFESVLYLEDVTDRLTPRNSGGRSYYTSVYVNEYYEYYSNGRGTWYRCDDYSRITSYALSCDGGAGGSRYYPLNSITNGVYWGNLGTNYTTSRGSNAYNVSHSGGDYHTTVLEAYLSTDSQNNLVFSPFTWTFSISGEYRTYVSVDLNHVHDELNNTLW